MQMIFELLENTNETRVDKIGVFIPNRSSGLIGKCDFQLTYLFSEIILLPIYLG